MDAMSCKMFTINFPQYHSKDLRVPTLRCDASLGKVRPSILGDQTVPLDAKFWISFGGSNCSIIFLGINIGCQIHQCFDQTVPFGSFCFFIQGSKVPL